MKTDGAITFIDHNFLWVSAIIVHVVGAYLRNSILASLLVHMKNTVPETGLLSSVCSALISLFFYFCIVCRSSVKASPRTDLHLLSIEYHIIKIDII